MKNRRMIWVAIGLLCVVFGPLVGLVLLSAMAKRPADLGVSQGRLAECPDSPNCVSSQTNNKGQFIKPLRFLPRATGDVDDDTSRQPIQAIAAIASKLPRARVVRQTDDYLHLEFTSRLFRFVDDVEFYVDPTRDIIQCRSASRVGRSDLGANRKRIEAIREALANPL